METKQEWGRIKELFGAALERDPRDRDAFLRAACGTDESLRLEVESLLQAHTSSGLWQHPFTPQPSGNTEGRFIGPYQLIKKIGEGGMGQVWLAQQTAPLQRQVALKLIRWGTYDDTLLHRFQAERQSLAVMDHPSIAKVFDAGATAEGQPYFVMEYVAGQPITDYCDQKKLRIRDRLELFVKVCEGVQHAHQKAIIHRDLKPANILVAEVDGKPVPRIIDFGLAKAINRDIAEETLNTRIGDFVGTPGYMSPEQCDPAARDIDTRTDVYSLGVVLYVLLTGSVPFETKEWKDKPFDEILRRLREQDPVRPSTKVSTDHQTSSSAAGARGTEPKQLVNTLRGDLDWITMKAVDRDRARRYPTASDLAADIRRYLNHEAVLAVPPSLSYRAHKFARRYRGALITACAFALVLVAAAVISIRQSIRATREAAVAQAVNDFLRNDLLAQASATTQSGPSAKPDPDLKVRTALDRAAQRIEGKFGKQPEVDASIRTTIGWTYGQLGLYAEARKQLERALELQRKVLGEENSMTLSTKNELGWIAMAQGKYPEAEALLTQTLAARRRVLGPEHRDTLATLHNLGVLYRDEGKYPQAEALDSQTLEIRRRVLGPEHPDTLLSMGNLAQIYSDEGKYPQAEALESQTLEIDRRVLGPEHPYTLNSMNILAIAYWWEHKYAQAEVLISQTLEIERRIYGPEHPDTLNAMNNLAGVYADEHKYAQAEGLYNQTLEIAHRIYGPEHPATLALMNNLAIDYQDEGKYAQAEALFTQTLEIRRRVLGPEHPDTLNAMDNLASDYVDEGKYAQAEVLLNQTLEIERRVVGPEHPYTLDALNNLVVDYQKQGKYALAETYAAQVLAARRRVFGPDDPNTILSEADLALADLSQGKFVQSEPHAREAVGRYQTKQPDDWQRFRAESLLGASLAGQKKYAEAEPQLLEGYQGMVARKDHISSSDRYHLQLAHQWIVQLYKDWGKPQKAAEIVKERNRKGSDRKQEGSLVGARVSSGIQTPR
jgi:serine/threonine protein kinase/tetratricopeptide (TPR) repeat protein